MTDAQWTVGDTTPLIALVQSLARLVLEDGSPRRRVAPEVLSENRFLAARDGLEAQLIGDVPRRPTATAVVTACSLLGESG